MSSFIWCMVAWCAPRRHWVIDQNVRDVCRPQKCSLCEAVSKTVLFWCENGSSEGMSLGCLLELVRLSYLIWKRRFRATCWYENQDHCPTDRYFMIIFWCPPGVWKHATLFCLSLSNLLTYIRLPYIRWKGTSIALIWGILSCSIPRGCIDMKEGSDLQNHPS